MHDVREALRCELKRRGFPTASDTLATRGEIYVAGPDDLAAALFEFKLTVHEATDTMYQGHWTADMPPRFAVLPADASNDPHFELLEQARITPLLYEVADDQVTFIDLDAALERLGR
jgi:hypothetical protein